MRITIYVHADDLENLNTALNSDEEIIGVVRILRNPTEDFVEVSLLYDEYIKCTDLEIFEELLSL